MMNIEKLYLDNQKKKKLHVFLTISFSILVILSISLFIIFSNFEIALLMKIVGSVVSSLLTILLISEIFAFLMPSLYFEQYLKELRMANETKVVGKISKVYEELVTVRKGIRFIKVDINEVTYFCSDEKVASYLSVSDTKTYIVRDCFIVGVENEK